MNMGKVLALDWGTVRWGWALSDPSQTLAARSGVYRLQNPVADLDFIKHMIQAEGVVEIVLGLPRNMDGSLGPQAQALLQFKRELERALALPCATFDERLTSAEAERALLEGGLSRARRKEKRDELAAILILQSYLNAKRNKLEPQEVQARWEHFDHQADVGVRGIGPTLEAAFEQAALALMAVMSDLKTIRPLQPLEVRLEAASNEQLLVDWLSELVYRVAVDQRLFSRFQVRIQNLRLRATAWGETLDVPRHQPAVEVKGISYSQLQVLQRADGGWVAQCVVDV